MRIRRAGPWRKIEDRRGRLRVGLSAIYGWYDRNAELAACVLRDAESHPLTKEIFELRFGPYMTGYQEVLGARLGVKQRAMLGWPSASSRGGHWSATVALNGKARSTQWSVPLSALQPNIRMNLFF